MDLISILAAEFKLKPEHVKNIVSLIDEGNTIPFIARYRKEMTGSCDDQVLRELSDRLTYLRNLEKRKAEVKESIAQQDKLTKELAEAIDKAVTLSEVEDLYRPFRPKRRTRATIAREKGLGPLADIIKAQNIRRGTVEELAAPFISEEKGVVTWEDAVAGALDIVAEDISDDAECRKRLRALMLRDGQLVSKALKEESSVYDMYREYTEPVAKIPSHRILAVNRGEKEEFLRVKIELNEDSALRILYDTFVVPGSVTTELVRSAAADAWKRLVQPSIEREVRGVLTDRASEQAIKMFGLNLKPLLLQPPVKNKVILGLDPGYRTGCKLAVVDQTGKVLDTAVIYPTTGQGKMEESKTILVRLIEKHQADVIAIGNGTASKESEIFVAGVIAGLSRPVQYTIVSEAGASVYSASKTGAEEFPNFDVTQRSAVSIARRLLDPLAELVKIDPKAIGVGQYQHDMEPARLDETLGGVVEDCVNSVGVDLNTASVYLLTYIAGLNAAVARNVVAYRDENGRFASRTQLKKVSKLGPKAFEQCAGFLRIPGGKNLLDNTAVHPESYDAAEKLLSMFGMKAGDAGTALLGQRVKEAGEEKVAAGLGIGVPTLRDMIGELMKPGRDIRDELPPPMLRTDIMELKDLVAGMELTGTVRNVIDFGVFVDIGVHQDGLVHISEVADRYIKHPSEVVSVGDVVKVTVLGVDTVKKRISLSMKKQK
jgi:uncharacterized protein